MKRSYKQRRERIQRDERSFHIQPKTKNQEQLLNAIEEYPITVTLGAAGVGKTYCAASKIAQLYLTGQYDYIILTRSNVPTGRSLGFFPGDIKEKLTPWLLPLISVLEKQLGKTKYEYILSKDILQLHPLETIS